MKHQSIFSLLLLAVALLLGACARAPEPVQLEAARKPALWKIQGDKGAVWLFGTIHMLPPDTGWQSAAFDEAVRTSDQLVLEASNLDDVNAIAAVFNDMGVSDGNPPLANRVDPDLHPVLDRLDAEIPGPRSVLDRMESWAAALALGSAQNTDLGLSMGQGVDQILIMRFRADGKSISGLETISEQFALFDQLTESDQRKLLDAVLRGTDGNDAAFEAMLAAWMRGDADAVLNNQKDGILASASIRNALFDRRNKAWAQKIDAMARKDQSVFVAVGAGHMAGPAGVPALLKAMGHNVQRIQ